MSLTKVTAAMTTGLAGGSHTHPISDVTNLQTSLDAKAASSHTHSAADITSGNLSMDRIAAGAIAPAKLSQPLTFATVKTATSTAVDFDTIPSWVKQINVMFADVSCAAGTGALLIQLGDAGGVENTGYLSSVGLVVASNQTGALSATNGFVVTTALASTTIVHGLVTLSLIDPATNKWVSSGAISPSNFAGGYTSGGSKALSQTLDRVRVTFSNGTDTFDAGSVNISYEG